MKNNVFISYSRQEVGFVDELAHQLEKEGFEIWLDYRSLVPGTPWARQIEQGVDRSDVILLVVSKSSMASKYVEFEWQRVVEMEGKRIMLLIFEAVELPEVLEKYEWVDFRGKYDDAMVELVRQVKAREEEEHPVPETGFRVPSIVWRAFWLSVLTALLSLPAWWTIFVPFFLLTLPYRIFKRDYNITQVQAALWLLPISLALTIITRLPDDWLLVGLFLLSLLAAPTLALVLRSRGMQRWGKPQACLTKFANPYHPGEEAPLPVAFFIDHAPQDRRVADEMVRKFQELGHPRAMEIETAKAVFVLLSGYKQDTEANPERQVVYPVMLQTCQPAEKLSKIQRIDFRGGVRNLDAMARLLPHPDRLLAALGVRPAGNRLVMPPIIMSMYYFLLLLGIFTLGSIVDSGLKNRKGFIAGLTATAISLPLLGVLLLLMLRALTRRSGRLASFMVFSLGLVGLGLLLYIHVIGQFVDVEAANNYTLTLTYPLYAHVVGMTVMGIFMAYRYRDVWRWFPAKSPKK